MSTAPPQESDVTSGIGARRTVSQGIRTALGRLPRFDTLGIHLAVNIFVATSILWLVLRRGANTTPIWAIASMVAVIDPQVNLAYQNFRAHPQHAAGVHRWVDLLDRGRFKRVEAPGGDVGDRPALVLRTSGATELAHCTDHRSPHHRCQPGASFEDERRRSRCPQDGGGDPGLSGRDTGHLAHRPGVAPAWNRRQCKSWPDQLIEGKERSRRYPWNQGPYDELICLNVRAVVCRRVTIPDDHLRQGRKRISESCFSFASSRSGDVGAV